MSEITVHQCCGCSCHVCAEGHDTPGVRFHTESCTERVYKDFEEVMKRLPTTGDRAG